MRLFALFLFGSALTVAQPALTDFIPPQSKVVIGINVRHMIDSAQLPDLETGSQSLSMLMLAQNGLSGLNPLKDVDSVLIASTGEGEQPPTVAILWGRFSNVQLVDKKNPKGIVRRIGDSMLAAGDPGIVNAIAEQRPGAMKITQALAERIATLADKYDVWGTGDNPQGFAAAKGQTGGLNADAVDHFEFGASFQKGLTAEAAFHLKSPQEAEKMTQSLQFFEAMLSAQKTPTNGTKFNLSTKDGTVKLALFIPEEELKKAMAAQKASLSLTPKPQPKPVDTRGKIVTNSTGDTVSVTLPGGH
ncbi:MAG: hypothetical protein P4L56_05775 [Candidatus Sulfopaludibacter sp.]|nr:hypothetical protein [Candidatus Sulfopaludibacter sp.]